ncbi:MAG: hypothetical protein A2284_08220 [Deltaproteobacteria bacterium RIFOXYA12_FULL_61_11]|nr:MAG: hypothetical protein A2284_08220 [Deltaproteobacteria bacterium RIFOXYA12_FULL_61_11]
MEGTIFRSSLERFSAVVRGHKLGVVCNYASVGPGFRHLVDLLRGHGHEVVAVFSPQHGFRGEQQANMIESEDGRDGRTGLPVYSLYGSTRTPRAETLAGVELLVGDLCDVGCRIYTYVSTLLNCLAATSALGKKLVVLDRPNPISGTAVEGTGLQPGLRSFVGMVPTVLRHGMTMGELLLLGKEAHGFRGELEVVGMEGWDRSAYLDELGLPWVYPSPNMPTVDTAVVFPGGCLLEGTNLSEGRGTTRPFELVGAPYLEAPALVERLERAELPGVVFREAWFRPTFDKHAGTLCAGVQLHVTDRRGFKPVLTFLWLLREVLAAHGKAFSWLPPPYEYVQDRMPFDILVGDARVRPMLERGAPLDELRGLLEEAVAEFLPRRRPFLLYGESFPEVEPC